MMKTYWSCNLPVASNPCNRVAVSPDQFDFSCKPPTTQPVRTTFSYYPYATLSHALALNRAHSAMVQRLSPSKLLE